MAVTAEQLNIMLAVRDEKFAKALKLNERRVGQFAKNTDRHVSTSVKSFRALAGAATALAPILAGAFSVQAIRSASSAAKEIKNLSTLAGMTAEEFQKLAIAADTVGFSQEKVADIFKDVNDKIGDFMATGAGPLKDFFENIAPQVGVTADQFARLSGPQALQLYVSSLEKAGVSQQQMTFYMEALANDATNLVPLLRNGGEEMRRLGDEAERSGRILGNDAVEAGARLDEKLTELTDTLRTRLQQAILDNADEITNFADTAVPAMIGGMTAIGTTAMSVAQSIGDLAGEIAALAAEAASFYEQAATWAEGAGLTAHRFFGSDESQWPDWMKMLRGGKVEGEYAHRNVRSAKEFDDIVARGAALPPVGSTNPQKYWTQTSSPNLSTKDSAAGTIRAKVSNIKANEPVKREHLERYNHESGQFEPFKKGGKVSASSRADGIAKRGKTRGRMV